jgi:alpha/beta superfamily hydrolase
MKEHVVVFGRYAQMVGVRLRAEDPCLPVRLVLVNSGAVHRVGANRMTVAIARALSADGVESLRFDLSGIGESSQRTDNLGWEASSPLEIAEAIDQIADQGAATVLYGNCGGAAKSLWAAQIDARVRGLLLTNPPAHPSEDEGIDEAGAGRIAQKIVDDLTALLERGVIMLFLFASGDSGLSYFEKRLKPSLAPYLQDNRLCVEIVERSNHTFSPALARSSVIAKARQWVRDRFGGQARPGGCE